MPSIALLKKELLVQLRRVRSFAWLLLLAVLMIWWVGAGWPRTDYQLAWGNVGRYSNDVFMGVSMLLFGGSVLFVPGIAATSIVVEKERGSWDPLFVTLLSPMGIFWGKLLSAIGLYLLFIVATFPIVSAIFFLIGIDWVQFLFAFGMILATTVTCGIIGVACSARFQSTLWAIFFSYLGAAILMGLPSLALLLVDEVVLESFGIYRNVFSSNEWLLFSMSAFATFAAGLEGYGGVSLVEHLVYQVVLAMVAFVWGALAIRRPPRPPVERGGAPIDDKTRLRDRRRRFPFYLLDPLQRPKPIEDGKNPVCEKELRWGFLRKRSLATRLFVVYFLLSLLSSTMLTVVFVDGPRSFSGETVMPLFLFQGAIVCAFVPVFLSRLFPKEHEQDNLDMLRMTLLSAKAVARGKYEAGLRIAGSLVAMTVVADLPLLIAAVLLGDGRSVWLFISGCVSLAVCVLLILGVTTRVSVMVRSTGPAIVGSFIAGLVALFGVIVVGALFAETFNLRLDDDEGLGLFLIYSSPPVAYVLESEGDHIEGHHAYWALSMIAYSIIALRLRRSAYKFYELKRWQDR